MRWRSPYSLKDAPPTEGSRLKTRKEHYKRRTNILPLAICWRRTVCFVLPAGNFTITTRIGKRGSAGCISKDQKFEALSRLAAVTIELRPHNNSPVVLMPAARGPPLAADLILA